MESYNVRLDRKPLLAFFSFLLPDGVYAVNKHHEEVSIVQENPIQFAIVSNDTSRPYHHTWTCKVVFGIQELVTSENEKLLFLTLKSVYPPGSSFHRPYLYRPWDHKRPFTEAKVREKFSIMREVFEPALITKRLKEWYEEMYKEMTEQEIIIKIHQDLNLEILNLGANESIYDWNTVMFEPE